MDSKVGLGPVVDVTDVVDRHFVFGNIRPGEDRQVGLPVPVVGGGHEGPVAQHNGKCCQEPQPCPEGAEPADQCQQAADREDTGGPGP